MSDDCGVIRSRLLLAGDHSGAPRLVPESKIVSHIVSGALLWAFWRVHIADADGADAALAVFSSAYTGCG